MLNSISFRLKTLWNKILTYLIKPLRIKQIETMNVKRIFGTILTILGIAALIYAGVSFMDTSVGKTGVKAIILGVVLGVMFFTAGIKLVSTTKDEV